MATDVTTILKFEVTDAVESIAELRAQVKEYKAAVDGMTIGSQEWQDATEQLTEAQTNLRKATSASTSNIVKLDGSYDSLTKKLRQLKNEWRAATTQAERDALAPQIREINNQLKDMDATVGDYFRNVGNYTNSITAAFEKLGGSNSGAIGAAASGFANMLPIIGNVFNAAKGGIAGISAALSSTGLGGLLMGVVVLVTNLKTVIDSITGSTDALNDVMERTQRNLDGISAAEAMTEKTIERRIELMKAEGKNEKEILSYRRSLLTVQIKSAQQDLQFAKSQKVNDEQLQKYRDHIAELNEKLLDIDNSIQAYDISSQRALDAERVSRYNDKLAEQQRILAEIKSWDDALLEDETDLYGDAAQEQYVNFLTNGVNAEITARQTAAAETERINAEMAADAAKTAGDIAAANIEADNRQMESARMLADVKREVMMSSLYAAGDILGALADLADEDSERQKRLQIAQATINTIAGAAGAFATAAANPGGIPGMIIGAVNAAAVTATGIAQIAKIRKTDPTGRSTASPSFSAPAAVSAPSYNPQIQEVHTNINGHDQQQLNEMIANQKVQLVYSDVEDAARYVDVVAAESTF